MAWPDDVVPLATWALCNEDLRHRFIHAGSASEVLETPGLAWSLETASVLAIFEAAISKGYRWEQTIDYECPYPGSKSGQNPRRSDLAFKDPGQGKNWGYVEVKYYDKGKVESDIRKLKSITRRSQRWMLVFRIRSLQGRSQTLRSLMTKNWGRRIAIYDESQFPTVTTSSEIGVCEICLFRVL